MSAADLLDAQWLDRAWDFGRPAKSETRLRSGLADLASEPAAANPPDGSVHEELGEIPPKAKPQAHNRTSRGLGSCSRTMPACGPTSPNGSHACAGRAESIEYC